MEEFLINFKDLFEDDEAQNLIPETKFRELDSWDSIMGLSVIGMIDDEYGLEFNADDMLKCQTIKDIFELVEKKK